MSILVVIAAVVGVPALACVGLAGMCSVCRVVDEGDDMFAPLDNPTETIFTMRKNEQIQEKSMKRNYALCRASTAKKEVARA